MHVSRPNNLSRWRAKQSEVARKRRGGDSIPRVVWAILFLVVVGMLVQLIALLFETANAVSNSSEDSPAAELDASGRATGMQAPGPLKVIQSGPDPDVEELMRRIRDALAPFQHKYLQSIGEKPPPCEASGPAWREAVKGYLSGCPPGDGCSRHQTLEEAKAACEAQAACGGVTLTGGMYELREGRAALDSASDEVSFVLNSCKTRATAEAVWEAFRETMEAALDDDDTLHLSTLYETREDGTIYLSISSYRDRTCSQTVRNAFRNARNPERLFVGIVQQNCNVENCFTGTGWGDTRRWVKQEGPDEDCIEAFCEENPELCKRQVRILRLGEREAYGPFFGRYLNSKLYRGENYFLQIDAHTYFREDWDYWIIDQMKRTPSYPFSVISNYPPGGDPTDTTLWPAPSGYSSASAPSALCGCSFEEAGGEHKTVRLVQSDRTFSRSVDRSRPHHSCFVAAGFLIAHGSIVNNVPFDPFLPWLFMGEEISLSIRFWTSGYDIYAPAIDVMKHEYVRKESPKFWESVGMVFSNGGIHNRLTDLIIPRVQKLVGWRDKPPRLNSVLARADQFKCGTVRTAQQFVQTMNIQVASLRQKPPTWCLRGTDQPDHTSKRATVN